MPLHARIQVFVSYAHEDRAWRDLVMPDLARVAPGAVWDDRKIPVGRRWREEIDAALSVSEVGVLLVSPAALASEFIGAVEGPKLTDKGRDRLFPLLVEPVCERCLSRAGWLGAIQVRPEDGVSLAKHEAESRRLASAHFALEVGARLVDLARQARAAEAEKGDQLVAAFRAARDHLPAMIYGATALLGLSMVTVVVLVLLEAFVGWETTEGAVLALALAFVAVVVLASTMYAGLAITQARAGRRADA